MLTVAVREGSPSRDCKVAEAERLHLVGVISWDRCMRTSMVDVAREASSRCGVLTAAVQCGIPQAMAAAELSIDVVACG